jgi:hypothetical protein
MSWDPQFERVRARMHSRVMAYRALFLHRVEPNPARWWQPAFWRVPQGGEIGPAADIVLRDLARYCYSNKPTLKVSRVTQQSDALAMAFAEGRRDVYNRIVALSNLTPDQIVNIAQRVNNDE